MGSKFTLLLLRTVFCKKNSNIMKGKRELKKVFPVLNVLSKLKEDDRKILLGYLNEESCTGIYDCVHNALHNKRLRNRNDLRRRIQQHKNELRYIVKDTRHSKEKQKKLVQSGGSIGLILSAVLPLLAQYLFKRK